MEQKQVDCWLLTAMSREAHKNNYGFIEESAFDVNGGMSFAYALCRTEIRFF